MSTARGIRNWPFLRLPLRLRIYICAVTLASVGVFVWVLVTQPPSFDHLGALALLLLCGSVVSETSRGFLRGLAGGFTQDLNSIWKLPVILLLPPSLAFVASVFLYLLWTQSVRKSSAVHRRVFNVAFLALGEMVGSIYFHATTGENPSLLVWFGCAVLAGLLIRVAHYALLGVVVLMTEPSALKRMLDREAVMYAGVEFSAGLIVALLALQSLFLVALAVLPVTMLHRSLLHDQLRTASRTDAKTAVLNAGAWEHDAGVELTRAKKAHESTSVLICDIDHFKLVNDEHGHLAGDEALRAVAQRLQALLRQGDILGRFGGEEFVILLSGIGVVNAKSIAERLRRNVAADPISVETGSISLTVSLGVATLENSDGSLAEMLAAADEALYAAKRGGRNRVVVARKLRAASPSGDDGPFVAEPRKSDDPDERETEDEPAVDDELPRVAEGHRRS